MKLQNTIRSHAHGSGYRPFTFALALSLAALPLLALADEPAKPNPQCREHSEAMLDALAKTDFAAASVNFDDAMKTALPPLALSRSWDALIAKYGQPHQRGAGRIGMAQGFTVVVTPLKFDQADLFAEVACASSGAVSGFHVLPVDSLPPAAEAPEKKS